jgi:uncharacterized protein
MLKTLHRGLWILSGTFFLLLGLIGLALPVFPQMIFFLLALFCFMRSSKRFTAWVEKKPIYIRFQTRRAAWQAKRKQRRDSAGKK